MLAQVPLSIMGPVGVLGGHRQATWQLGGLVAAATQPAKLQRIATGEFSAQFGLSLALKDVRLALQAAGDDGLAVLACLAEEWQQAVDKGLGDQDLTVVTRVLEQQGGTPWP